MMPLSSRRLAPCLASSRVILSHLILDKAMLSFVPFCLPCPSVSSRIKPCRLSSRSVPCPSISSRAILDEAMSSFVPLCPVSFRLASSALEASHVLPALHRPPRFFSAGMSFLPGFLSPLRFVRFCVPLIPAEHTMPMRRRWAFSPGSIPAATFLSMRADMASRFLTKHATCSTIVFITEGRRLEQCWKSDESVLCR